MKKSYHSFAVKIAYDILLFSDSILKYVPEWQTLDSTTLHYQKKVQRGGTITSLERDLIDPYLEASHPTPDAVVLHAGTNNLSNYWQVCCLVVKYVHIIIAANVFHFILLFFDNVSIQRKAYDTLMKTSVYA